MLAIAASMITMVVSSVLGVRLIMRYLRRPVPHSLYYGLALILTAVAAGSGVVAHGAGVWPLWLQRLYWFSGAALVGLMSMGAVAMGVRRPLLNGLYHLLMVAALVWLGMVVASAPAASSLTPSLTRAPEGVRPAFLLVSIVGASVLLLGTGYSWWRNRGSYHALIVLAVALFWMSGSTGGRFGEPGLFYGLQAVASLALYAGVSGSLVRRSQSRGLLAR